MHTLRSTMVASLLVLFLCPITSRAQVTPAEPAGKTAAPPPAGMSGPPRPRSRRGRARSRPLPEPTILLSFHSLLT